MSYEGYMTENEYRCLRRYAGFAKVGIMDIGTFNGASAKEMRIAASEKIPVWTIDYFPVNSGRERSPINIMNENLCGIGPVFIIIGGSQLIGQFWETPLDLLVIDGSHTFDGVSADFNLFVRSLVPGGTVILHDALNKETAFKAVNGSVVQANTGVCEFIDKILSEDWVLVESVDTIAVVRRASDENIDVI